MDDIDFTEDEIRDELQSLGYRNVPPERIKEFKRDLESLIKVDRSLSGGSSLSTSVSDSATNGSHSAENRYEDEKWKRLSSMTTAPKPLSMTTAPKPSIETGVLHERNFEFSSNDSRNYSDKNIHFNSKISHDVDRSAEPIVKSYSSLSFLRPCLVKTTEDEGDVENYRHRYPSVHVNGGGGGGRMEETEWTMESGRRGGDVDDSTLTNSSTSSSEQKTMKRKILRKINGKVEVSVAEANDSDDISRLNDQMKNLHVLNDRPFSAPPVVTSSSSSNRPRNDDVTRDRHSHVSCRSHVSYNLPDSYEGPKSLIRPMSCDPHMCNVKKSDPVAQYHKYRGSWKVCKAPGERSHKQLRWDVREQMLHQDQVIAKKSNQPVHQANPYVVPSDKKRKTLRWQIRNDLAHGIKPPSMFD